VKGIANGDITTPSAKSKKQKNNQIVMFPFGYGKNKSAKIFRLNDCHWFRVIICVNKQTEMQTNLE
jgi:hypothetical protein